jgi:hypothetical protein
MQLVVMHCSFKAKPIGNVTGQGSATGSTTGHVIMSHCRFSVSGRLTRMLLRIATL